MRRSGNQEAPPPKPSDFRKYKQVLKELIKHLRAELRIREHGEDCAVWKYEWKDDSENPCTCWRSHLDCVLNQAEAKITMIKKRKS